MIEEICERLFDITDDEEFVENVLVIVSKTKKRQVEMLKFLKTESKLTEEEVFFKIVEFMKQGYK